MKTPSVPIPSPADQSPALFSPSSWLGAGRSILFARGSDAAARFVLFLAAARVLTSTDFSVYALLTAALATCQWTLSLGAPRIALYFHALGRRGTLFGWLYLLALFASVPVFGVTLAAPPLRHVLFPAVPTGWILLGLAPLPFSLVGDSLASTLIAAGRTRAYGATLWIRNAGTAIVLASSLTSRDRLLWILAGRLAVQGGVAAITAVAAHARPRMGGLRAFIPEALAYGVPTALSDGVVAVHRRADVFLLSALGRTPEIGAYALAYALAEAFWLVTDSFEAALFVDITRRPDVDARAAAARAFRLSLWIGLCGFLPGVLLAQGLRSVFFGGRYSDARGLLPWTLAAAVAWGVSRPFASYLGSRGRLRALVACHTASLAANLLANVLLIPRHGAMGAAIASLASYTLDAILLGIAFRWTGAAGDRAAAGDRTSSNGGLEPD